VDINRRAAGSWQAGNLIGGYSWRQSTLLSAADRLHRQLFMTDTNC